MSSKKQNEYDEEFNETSNSGAGINTPKENQGTGAADMLAGFVEGTMENIQHTFDDEPADRDRD